MSRRAPVRTRSGGSLRSLTGGQRALLGVGVAIALVLVSINGAVAFFGNSSVFPLSPLALDAKVQALQRYALHRPRCLWASHPLLPDLIRTTESRYGLPTGLLQSVVENESGGEPHRISPAGAMGLTQLVPSTARMFGVRDPYDSEASLNAGAHYLSILLKQFKEIRLAVAAYNAGPGNVVGGVVPHNGETEHYVVRVMARYAQLAPPAPRTTNRTRASTPRPPTSHSFRPSSRSP